MRSRDCEGLSRPLVQVELVAALALETGHVVALEVPFPFWWTLNFAATPGTVQCQKNKRPLKTVVVVLDI
jgi:hypothetical protein